MQSTIDRIVFLRICEARGIERYGQLLAQAEGERVYPRLGELFRRADERYNSGLFHVERTPIRPIDPSRPEDVARHDRLVSLVVQMLELHKLLAAARTGHERTALERQIEATDGQIDRLVYELLWTHGGGDRYCAGGGQINAIKWRRLVVMMISPFPEAPQGDPAFPTILPASPT